MTIARLLAVTVLVIAHGCLSAQEAESGWTLRFYGALVDSSAEFRTSPDGSASRVGAGGGVGVGAEYRVSRRLGVEVSTLVAGLDAEATASAGRAVVTHNLDVGMVPLTLGLTLHLSSRGGPDVFLAPTVSYVSYSGLEATYDWSGARFAVDARSDLAFGAALGLDLPFGTRKWMVSAGLRYMKTDANETAIDPVITTLGLGRRF